jgi:hypothetical protein
MSFDFAEFVFAIQVRVARAGGERGFGPGFFSWPVSHRLAVGFSESARRFNP